MSASSQTDRLALIAARIAELQRRMAERGIADASVELLEEHGALVRERNTILSTKGTR